MRRLGLLAVLFVVSAGCNTLRPKNDNPVMQAPPRRVSMDDSQAGDQLAGKSATAIKQASAADVGDDAEVFNAQVVARVNGAPVFAGDVLERYGPFLKGFKANKTPEEFQEIRSHIIERDLRSHIERRLLAERLKSSLKPDQIKQLEGHVDKVFQKEIDKLKNELQVSTKTELELALNEKGTTLDAVKDGFTTQRLAMEYLAEHVQRPPALTRPELVAYYQAHLDDYKIPARVQWEQVQVSWDRQVGRAEARTKIQQAQQALQRGQPFDQVAKQFSDGPTATSGGRWDWTNRGSLAEQKLETAIFEQPVGQLSPIIEGRTGFHLVRVVDREAETRKPFAELQDEIAATMEKERQANLPQKFVEQLYNEAIIETTYNLAAAETPAAR
jgi:parvulin-like peptidyl-prolyl isomerase